MAEGINACKSAVSPAGFGGAGFFSGGCWTESGSDSGSDETDFVFLAVSK